MQVTGALDLVGFWRFGGQKVTLPPSADWLVPVSRDR